jgi:NAD(P)-dependent dehydrogenase (short-subunit alcohol dehydrogenase family)
MLNFIDFTGRRILVTGATSGIGLEICKQISNYGGSVIGIGRNTEVLNSLTNQLTNFKGIKYDLSDLESLDKLIEKIDLPFDGIVHSAGIVQLLPIKFFDLNILNKIRKVNYDSILLIISKLLKIKKINKGASIVFISSIAGEMGMKGNSIYSSTKAALNSTTKVLAAELSSQLIRVNSIAPGQVVTNLTEEISSKVSAESIAIDKTKYPLGYGMPEDISNLAIFLLSSKSRWITGTIVNIDGGRSSVLN